MNILFPLISLSVRLYIGISILSVVFLVLTPTVFTESRTFQPDATAGLQTAGVDATLSSLTLGGVPFNEVFSPGRTTYTAETYMTEVVVTAVLTYDGATVTPSAVDSENGHRIDLEEEETVIAVTVTAEDGETTKTYTISVVKPPAPSTTDETVSLIESESDTQTTSVTSIIATPGNAQATITWETSSITDVVGWQFSYKSQAAGSWEDWTDVPSSTAGTTSYTIPSLVNGTAYVFKIRSRGSGAIRGTESAVAVAVPNTDISAVDFDSNDNNLIEITTLEQLHAVRYDLDGTGVASGTVVDKNTYYDAFTTSQAGFFCSACVGYELMNDLDFNTGAAVRSDDTYYNGGSGWEPIGSNTHPFTAIFDGNGFVIKNLHIFRTTVNQVGLFSVVHTPGILTEVALKDVSVRGGPYNTGSLVGINGGTVRASYAAGTVTGRRYVGGLVGSNIRGTIESSYSTADVSTIISTAGGLASSNLFSEASIRNSYSIGSVAGSGTKGGLVAENSAAVTNSYWNTSTSGQATSVGGVGKTTAELQSPTGYTGIYSTWDDTDIDGSGGTDAPWDFGTNKQYPLLTFGGHTVQKQFPEITSIIAAPNSDRVTLTWTAENIASVTGWEFTYKTQTAGSWESWADVPSSTASTTSHTISSLTNDTTYLFKVRVKGSAGSRVVESAVAVATPAVIVFAVDFDANDNNLIDITTLAQLDAIRYDPDGDGVASGAVGDMIAYHHAFKTSRAGFFCDACVGYELRKSLDFDTDGDGSTWTGTAATPSADSGDTYHNSGKGWIPIDTYTATFDGNGYIIDNLFVKRGVGDSGEGGLFKGVGVGGIVRNLGLRDVLVRTPGDAGGIAGVNSGTIQTSFVTGSTFGNSSGLITAKNAGTVAHSYSRGVVSASGAGAAAGGIAGNRETTGGTIKNSWTATTVTQTGGTKSGIATAGTIVHSYFDSTVYGTTTDPNGKTTAELQAPTDYTGIYSAWDDDDIDGVAGVDAPWDFGADSEYPILAFGGHLATTQQFTIIANPGSAQATLTWVTLEIAGVTGWQVAYKTKDAIAWEGWIDIPSSSAGTRRHTVSSLVNGTTYLFKIRTKRGSLFGVESAVAVATPNTGISAVDFDVNDNNLIDITTLEQLHAVRYDLDGDGVLHGSVEDTAAYYSAFATSQPGFFCDLCAGYELMNDLDFSGSQWLTGDGWEPIGVSSSAFATTFNGNGFIIDNLYLSRGSTSDVGLFGAIATGGSVVAVALKNVSVTGGVGTGALAGRNSGTIKAAYATGSVTGANNTGGLVGFNSNGTITDSYSTASVTAGSDHSVGGLVGSQGGSDAVISRSYSLGLVRGSGGAVGGFLGRKSAGVVLASYWNTETSGQADSAGGSGSTTVELQTPANDEYLDETVYETWVVYDFSYRISARTTSWDFGTDSEYPVLIFGGHQAYAQRIPDIPAFTLDLDKSGTFVARQDLLGAYLYLAEGINATQLRTYTHDQGQPTAVEMIKTIDANTSGATAPLDLDGSGTVSARLDILGAYLYTAEGISATQLRAYTHDQRQPTAVNMIDRIDALIE